MTDFNTIVTDEFSKAFDAARSRGMTDLAAAMIAEHPLLKDTLAACSGVEGDVDELSSALTKRADELAKLAAADRTDPQWGDICIAMGAVRNAAAAVWRYEDEIKMANFKIDR